MADTNSCLSEEDIRTKVVWVWLADHGIRPDEVSLEYSFEIRLGRSTWKVGAGGTGAPGVGSASGQRPTARPRADVLVRRGGKNLLIVEVKAPDEPLDDDARDQGISYARLLPDMTPFVVLTNGVETQIFDTLTRERIDGQRIPPDHPSAKAGFRVSGEELRLRAEALELFISLSPENLLLFCERQVAFRMARLRSEDPHSGKKYVPSLYVERKRAKDRLLELLDGRGARTVALIGRPQVGKTNFLCHFVEERLSQGHPCLFYPAIGLRRGLLDDIAEDLGWMTGSGPASPPVVVGRLAAVLRRAGKRLTLFIDGWNEADVRTARDIDRECERLACTEIQVVVSFTTSSARRLLVDAGNPSFIADATAIGIAGAGLINVAPEDVAMRAEWNAAYVEPFDADERDAAYTKYGQQYRVEVPPAHQRTSDPYLLAVAMRRFGDAVLPIRLDEPELLEEWVLEKVGRVANSDGFDIKTCLTELGAQMLSSGAPVPESDLKRRCGMAVVQQLPPGLFDAALLIAVGTSPSAAAIDFYNTRDRDYVLSCWSGRWRERLKCLREITSAFEAAVLSNAGRDALDWFLRQPGHIEALEDQDGLLPHFEDAGVQRILLSAAGAIARLRTRLLHEALELGKRKFDRDQEYQRRIHLEFSKPKRWLDYALAAAKDDPDKGVRIEALKLLVALVEDEEPLVQALPDGEALQDFVLGLLEIHNEFPLLLDTAGSVVLKAMHELHSEYAGYYADEEVESDLTEILRRLWLEGRPTVQEAAFCCLGYLVPRWLLSEVGKAHSVRELSRADVLGVRNAAEALDEMYRPATPMCPTYLDSLDGDAERQAHEYRQLHALIAPLYRFLQFVDALHGLREVLEYLRSAIPAGERGRLPPLPGPPDTADLPLFPGYQES
jgi:hypothetical protein